jgi:dihydropyrimidinase
LLYGFGPSDSLRYYAESRPVEAEVRAVRTAVELSEQTGAPIYIVHLSSARALAVCADARRRGVPVFVETRPTYLHLTSDLYGATDGQKYICEPPLRARDDVEAMWAGLANGAIDCLASDHAPWTLDQKLDPGLTYEHHRAGVSNLREVLPMLFSEGVIGGRISPERFVAVTSTNAAKIFGLFPRKGTIDSGSDADLVIWNPEKTRTVEREQVISRSGYSVYEGASVRGWPEVVVARGQVAFADGEVRRLPGDGLVLRREASGAPRP